MSEAQPASTETGNREAALAALYDDVHRGHMFPFWATTTDVAHDEIRQLMGSRGAVPHLWRYESEIGPLLRRSAELVSMADSERRSLILVNPGLAPTRATVSTMYSAYRLNDPNEVMPPHRHSPNAIRLGLTGSMNFTGVEGEDIVFGPGDMVLTPQGHLAQPRQQGRRASREPLRARPAAGRGAQRHLLRARLQGREGRPHGRREGTVRPLQRRLFGGGLRCRRPDALLRAPRARQRHRLADVRLPLGADARNAGGAPQPRRRPSRGPDGGIRRSHPRRPRCSGP